MRCGVTVSAMNSGDWDRVRAENWDSAPAVPDHQIWDEALEIGDMIEPLGFDSLWTGEHFATPMGMTPSSPQLLAYFAGRTSRVDMGTMVVVLPWWHPVRAAHEIAMLDILLKGRNYTLGVGRGLSPKEFAPLGVPQEQARDRFNEIVDVLKLGYSQERFAYEGKIFKIPEMSIRPQPRHRDLMSRAVGGFVSMASLENVARAGLGQLSVTAESFEKIGKDTLAFNKIRQEIGLSTDSQPIVFLNAICGPNNAEVERMRPYLDFPDARYHYGLDDAETFKNVKGYEHYLQTAATGTASQKAAPGKPLSVTGSAVADTVQMVGTPDQLIEKFKEMQRKTSAREALLMFNFGRMPHADAIKSIQLFAKEVLPAVHEIPAKLHSEHTI